MASAIYRRPNLWPFSYAGMPDLSGQPYMAVGGTTEQALQLMTQVKNMTVSVAWNVFYPSSVSPIYDYTSIFNNTVNFDSPGASPATSFGTGYGYYYSNYGGGRWTSPAERVLVPPGDSTLPWPSLSTIYEPTQPLKTLEGSISLSKTNAGLVQSCLVINAQDSGVTGVSLNYPGSTYPLATTPISLYGIDFGLLYLYSNNNPDPSFLPVVNLFSASASVTLY